MKRSKIFLLVFLIAVCALVGNTVFAQGAGTNKETKNQHKKNRHLSDSAWKKEIIISDTAAALAINHIEQINSILKSYDEVIHRGFDTSEISESLPRIQRNINLIQYNVSSVSGSFNLRNLSLVQDILGDIIDDLKAWQTALLSYYTELVSINSQMRAISVDSSSFKLPSDTALRLLYIRQVNELKAKWQSTDAITKQTILKIDLLQRTVSAEYEEAVGLEIKINNLIKAYSKNILHNEYSYLWQLPPVDSSQKSLKEIVRKSVWITGKVLEYYLGDNWGGRITAIIISVLFFLWVYLNINKLRKTNIDILNQLKYIRPFPILSTLILLFTLIPFLDVDPPMVFVEGMQLLLVTVLTLLLAKRWPKNLFPFWLVLFFLLIFHSIEGVLISITNSTRIILFSVDLFSIIFGWKLYKVVKKNRIYFPSYLGTVTLLYIILNSLSSICNLFGRVTLAHIFGNAAISNLVQAISLTIFIQIFLEATFLQLEADKKSTRFTAYLNYQNVEMRLRNILTFIVGIFWFINLTQNLNIYESTYNFLSNFLSKERSVGNTSFTVGSIVIFFFIIWIANFLQKYIGYFFGDTDDELMPDKKSKLGTSVLLIRLVILTAGFFIGILASGIPLDKVTIIIGALGVGIGLGLQHIVNNLVSGVILAIERPIQVGDLIEIESTSGRVKEIGIRSSRIVTAEGAEVIIPNGDMLSQKLINWTLSNSHMRVEIILKLASASDAEKAKQFIVAILMNNKEVMSKPEPQIVIRNITQTGAEIQVLFWVFDINKWVQLKSDILLAIYEKCTQENISFI